MKIDINIFIQQQLLITTNKKFSIAYISRSITPIIDKIINTNDNKFLISGSQGVGKSTLAIIIKLVIEKIYKKKVMILSIDDYYLSKNKRNEISKKIHPLLKTRGVPGTHDINKLRRHINNFNKQKFPISTPKFDKLKDDCSKTLNKVTSAQILILEGWCCGTSAVEDKYLYKNINKLELNLDKNFVWRKYYNSILKNQYQSVFKMFDITIYLKPPSFAYVLKWRALQEKNNAIKNNQKKLMNKKELSFFIQHYEKITKWMIKTMPAKADILINLDRNQKIKKIT
jgi:D-glycerate 3-kinase